MSELRRGMWVRQGRRTGIVTVPGAEQVMVDWTDDEGFTIGSETVPSGSLRQARLAEIPQSRRPAKTHGAALGYA